MDATPLPLASRPVVGDEQRRPGGSDPPLHLLGVSAAELQSWAKARGLDGYRATQILEWVYQRGADSFEAMTNLPKALRNGLAQQTELYRGRIAAEDVAADGTRKLVIGWPDSTAVETVWIPARERHTACLSSQVGCPVGCRFCASGLDGLQRNLTAGEIVEQAMRVRRCIETQQATAERSATGEAPSARLSNIVLMGMGEPLANYRAVMAAVRILNAPWGLGIGARKITISTVGLPSQIRQLAHEDLQLNLALSLHAPEDALRAELIPWGRGVRIAELLAACRYYFRETGREITLEYVLLEGVNDRPAHADKLARIARGLRANVNLLRYNPVEGLAYRRPSAASAYEFQRRLRAVGVNAHVRTSRGSDVAAACGQLRRTTEAGG